MDPQLDVNVLIHILRGVPEFVAFASASQAAGLTYNAAVQSEFLANGLGTDQELQALAQVYGIVLLTDVLPPEIDVTARQLQAAFAGDTRGRLLHEADARVLATG
jgi:hypothetical protein